MLARRYQMRFVASVSAIRHSMSLREAEKKFELPLTTLHLVLNLTLTTSGAVNIPRNPHGFRPEFTAEEEKIIVEIF